MQQGEIHFGIEYLEEKEFHKEIMPKNTTIYFKKDNILFDMTSKVGNSGMIYLSNPYKGIHDMYCNILSMKHYYQATDDEMMPGFESMANPVFVNTGDTKEICGYLCNCSEVSFPSVNGKKYKIWYTNEIDIKSPNKCTPYEQIEGVLMDFVFIFDNVEMHFSAENVYDTTIDDDFFSRKNDYTLTDKSDIIQFINKMLTL